MIRSFMIYLYLILLCGCATSTLITTSKPIATAFPTSAPKPSIGSTFNRPADGMVMVFVPEGEFSMGSPDNFGFPYEHPAHTVFLDGYWFDKTDVTNAMYAGCVKAGACTPPWENKSASHESYYGNPQYDNFPVIFVDWNQATGYCLWAGVRLPTEAEWEKAARGTDGRIYPWGNTDPTCALANFADGTGCTGDTSAVGMYPAGASPYGALDMSGNVWQWVTDWYDPLYYSKSPNQNPPGPAEHGEDSMERVVRGGSWQAKPDWIHSANRVAFEMTNRDNVVGFRCTSPAK
jgi:eukaryotic-like serine/threonine-protein kinase